MFLALLFRLVDLLFAIGMTGSVVVLFWTGVEDALTIYHSIFK